METEVGKFSGIREQLSNTSNFESSILAGKRVLLVDDDSVFRCIMVRMAAKLGAELEAYESMIDLDPFARLESYDGAIFDYHLGELDGVNIIKHLQPFFKRMPILLVSADLSAGTELLKAENCGHCVFVSKKNGALKILKALGQMMSAN